MALNALLILVKVGLYGSSLFAVGLVVHRQVGLPAPTRLLPVLGLVLLAFVAARFLLMVFQLGGGLGAPFDGSMVPFVWEAGRLQIIVFVLGGACLVGSRWSASSAVPLVGALLVISGFGLGGHTQGVADPLLSPLAVIAHVALAGFWIAAPLTLFPKKGRQEQPSIATLERFSAIALWVVPLAFVLGIALLLRLAGGIEPVFTTDYGRLLLTKSLLAAAALALGAYNKTIVTSRIKNERSGGIVLLRKVLVGEAVLFALVLVAVAIATTIMGPER
ncbi:MAG: CopD family protein [Pseudomonadota bacterium]